MGKNDPSPELAARLRSFHDLPEGTLGRAYVDFCDRNHLDYPGDNPNQPAVFVAHDMTHVITGYEPTGPGELALGAFQISMNDSDAPAVRRRLLGRRPPGHGGTSPRRRARGLRGASGGPRPVAGSPRPRSG
jgi:hypothetical protein